jgi:hypothetical protein
VSGSGILINLCDNAIVTDNEIIDVNVIDKHLDQADAWQESAVAFYGSYHGTVARNRIENTQGSAGAARHAIFINSPTETVAVSNDNVLLHMRDREIYIPHD